MDSAVAEKSSDFQVVDHEVKVVRNDGEFFANIKQLGKYTFLPSRELVELVHNQTTADGKVLRAVDGNAPNKEHTKGAGGSLTAVLGIVYEVGVDLSAGNSGVIRLTGYDPGFDNLAWIDAEQRLLQMHVKSSFQSKGRPLFEIYDANPKQGQTKDKFHLLEKDSVLVYVSPDENIRTDGMLSQFWTTPFTVKTYKEIDASIARCDKCREIISDAGERLLRGELKSKKGDLCERHKSDDVFWVRHARGQPVINLSIWRVHMKAIDDLYKKSVIGVDANISRIK